METPFVPESSSLQFTLLNWQVVNPDWLDLDNRDAWED